MWEYEDAMFYNQLLKEGYRDDAIIMDESCTEDDWDMDDWESDDYLLD